MPYAMTDGGVRLYFEESGSGRPVILVHIRDAPADLSMGPQ
jgi:hypothetical protein